MPEKLAAITPAAPGGSRRARARSSGSASSRSTSRARIRAISSGFGVVVAEHVEHAVHDEQRQLVVDGAGVARGLARRPRRADHDVAEQERQVAGIERRAIGAAALRAGAVVDLHELAASIGKASTSVGPALAEELAR